MPFVLIKNNFKLMLRSKWLLAALILFPLFITAILSSVFEDLLNADYELDEFKVGYRIESDDTLASAMDELMQVCKSNNIVLVNFPEGDITNLLANETVSVFVDIGDEKYTIYQLDERAVEAAVIESIFSTFFHEYNMQMVIARYQIEHGVISMDDGTQVKEQTFVTTKKLEVDPKPSAIDYYGIIEVVFFLWCGVISITAVITSERKSDIERKMQTTPVTKVKLYLGKLIPCMLTIILAVGALLALTTFLFGTKWGNLPQSIGILLLMSIAASAFGVMLFYLFKNVVVSIAVLWVLMFASGFTGGTFETYMYSSLPDYIVRLSPHYYMNRTLVEFSTKGSSDYAIQCVLILLGITVGSIIIGLAIMNRRLEEQ